MSQTAPTYFCLTGSEIRKITYIVLSCSPSLQKFPFLKAVFKNFLFIFNWRIIVSQYCDGFCHTVTWISHSCRHVSRSWNSFPPPIPLGGHREQGWAPSITHQVSLAIYFTYGNVYVLMLLSQFIIPPSPFSTVSTCLFSMSASPLLPCR